MEAYIATVGVSGADKGQRSGRRPSDGHRTPALRSDRRYLRYKLSFRDLVEMMAERGIVFSHTRAMRWVQCYTPEFEKRWNHFASPAGRSWRVDETYVKIRGEWVDLYASCGRQAGQDNRLPAQSPARCRRRQGVLSQGAEDTGPHTRERHARGLRSVASGDP